MSQPFIGEIRIFAGNFAPNGWAFCDGQSLPIAQFDALFSLLGTSHGGDGQTTFNLPDMRGRVPVHSGTGPGLSLRRLGDRDGVETVSLTSQQLPAHSHVLQGSSSPADSRNPRGRVLARAAEPLFLPSTGAPPSEGMSNEAIGTDPGPQPHPNMMPYLCLNFIIALLGIYPQRT